MLGTHRRQVENGTRSQNIAIGLEVNALCREVDHEVEIACSDLIEFENQGVSLVLERDPRPDQIQGVARGANRSVNIDPVANLKGAMHKGEVVVVEGEYIRA